MLPAAGYNEIAHLGNHWLSGYIIKPSIMFEQQVLVIIMIILMRMCENTHYVSEIMLISSHIIYVAIMPPRQWWQYHIQIELYLGLLNEDFQSIIFYCVFLYHYFKYFSTCIVGKIVDSHNEFCGLTFIMEFLAAFAIYLVCCALVFGLYVLSDIPYFKNGFARKSKTFLEKVSNG